MLNNYILRNEAAPAVNLSSNVRRETAETHEHPCPCLSDIFSFKSFSMRTILETMQIKSSSRKTKQKTYSR